MGRFRLPAIPLLLFLCSLAALFPAESQAKALTKEAVLQYYLDACAAWDVHPKLALAISCVESGLNPWAVNVEGTAYMPKTRKEALRIVDDAWAKGASFDVGLMQVNSYWMRKYRISPRTLLSPKRNIVMGTWILSKEIERYGLNWKAVASYHTPVDRNFQKGKEYALTVIARMERMNRAKAKQTAEAKN